MQPLLAALAYSFGVAIGLAIAPMAGAEVAMWCLSAGAAACVIACFDTRRGSQALVCGALALGLVRARVSAYLPQGSEARGQPRTVEVRVAGASRPGARCAVELSGGAWLTISNEDCPRSPGERLVLPAGARVGDLGPLLPTTASREQLGRAESRVDSEEVFVTRSGAGGYWAWVAEQRQRAWELSRGDPALGLVVASALGVRQALPPEDRDALRAAGLGHLIAVSGVHVGVAALLVYGLVVRLSALFGATPRMAVLLSWLPVIGYVGLTGAAPSAVRAAVMLTVVGLGTATGRPAHGVASLALAGALMLAFEPAWAIDPGFQLSMAAMAAIVTAAPNLGIVGQSWRVGWAVAPVSWWHFGQTSAYGLMTNVVAIPVFSLWILPSAVMGWLSTPWLGAAGLHPARTGTELILDLSRFVAARPQPDSRALAVAAGLAVLASATLRLGGRTSWSAWIRRRNVVPPLLTSLGLLVALSWPASGGDTHFWYAVGGRRSLAVIAPAPGSAEVCIREPRWSPSTWSNLLAALDIAQVRAVSASPGEPAAAALRRDLAARGWLGSGRDDCVAVDAAWARVLLTRCLERRGTGRGIIRGGNDQGTIDCFAAGQWRRLGSEDP